MRIRGSENRIRAVRRAIAVLTASALILHMSVLTPLAASPEDAAVISLVNKYDSMDTAVVRSVNSAEGTVTFCQHDLGRYYTLQADNTSMIYDRYERPISAALLSPGEVVDVTFLHQSKHLNSLVVSQPSWTREGVREYRIDAEAEILTMDGQNYHLPKTALLLAQSSGGVARIIAEEILTGDVLTVSGIDKEIYSVTVTGGHGYLRLTSTEVNGTDITGAWLNLDNKIIQRVNEKTLVTAPEGTYNMQITGQGANDVRPVIIERGRETVIDASSIQLITPDTTEITFEILPEKAAQAAKITVDQQTVYPNYPVSLTQGVHQVRITAEGYITRTENLKVGTKNATVTLELDEDTDASAAASTAASSASFADTAATWNTASTAGTSDWWYSQTGYSGTGATDGASAASSSSATAGSGSTATSVTVVDVSGNETTRTTLSGYEVRVESPEGVEFYMDGNYMGITPTSFTKVSGQHTVTLSREGYETKSYNIFIDDALTNKTYAFPELVREETEE